LVDKTRGEANFDIEGEKIDQTTPFLFKEMNVSSKVSLFQKELEEKILKREIKNDVEMYYFMINNGFQGEHVKPVLKKLKGDKKIQVKQPAFKYKTVLNKKRKPKEILIL